MATDKKVKYSQSEEAKRNRRKMKFKGRIEKHKARKIADAGDRKQRMLTNLYLQDRTTDYGTPYTKHKGPETTYHTKGATTKDFPGFDQAHRIRGGLKKGGRTGLKHGGSAGAAKRGHGAEIK